MTRALLLNAQRPVDLRTRRRAVLHWLDWIGCVAAGCRAPVGEVLRRLQPLAGATESLIGPAADAWQAEGGRLLTYSPLILRHRPVHR